MTTYTLADRVDYNIVTALRGPDGAGTQSNLIKWITTCVIRYFAGVSGLGSGIVVSPNDAKCIWYSYIDETPIENKIIGPDLRRALIQSYFNTTTGWHFAVHVGRAFRALAIKFPAQEPRIREYYDWLTGEFPNTPLGEEETNAL